ncbi:sulfotransferase family 2 domain-containing protein [Luminiphilus sp. nBUS_16]|uniref:sulfotransferase family 2 domain-containing protein n=1 Tax=Luminiphilus sp. nBUS_16 TaxID=3395315 RepID=UPI003EBB7732
MNSKRSVIVHYHTFKNSGTSFDELLTANYKEDHLCFDGPFPYTMFNQQELLKVIRRNPTKIAFSSHSIRLPVPTDLDVNAVAALFIRHPILRIRSVYGFEMRSEGMKAKLQTAVKSKLFMRKKIAQEDTAKTDKQPTFDEWVTYLRGHTASNLNAGLLSNSQTHMFCGVYGSVGIAKTFSAGGPKAVRLSDLDQAKRNLLAVPLLARTETFEQDVKRFPEILARYGIEFNYQDLPAANVSNPKAHRSVKDRLLHAEGELSEDNWSWLNNANAQDLDLYDFSNELLS